MDNADLTKLLVAPGKLLPKFNPNITSYSATVGSNVSEVKITALTSDAGASYSIKVSTSNLQCKKIYVDIISIARRAEMGAK